MANILTSPNLIVNRDFGAGLVDGKKLRLIAPKNGRPQEHIYLPQKLANRLGTYIKSRVFGH